MENKTDNIENRGGLSLAVFNKNFGNIRNAGTRYSFEITPVGNGYKKFATWENGAAAMLVHLYRYMTGRLYRKDVKRDTIEKIINTWAPPTENATQNYIDYVAKESGIRRNEMIAYAPGTMYLITKAMSKREDRNAAVFFNAEMFDKSWDIAAKEINRLYKTDVPKLANSEIS